MWWKLSRDACANLEAQMVVALRLLKLAKGGPAAQKEAHKMVSEKLVASVKAATTLVGGGSLQSVVKRYRTIVRANKKRLSGNKGKRSWVLRSQWRGTP
jgi:hypothetical protein